MKKKEKSNRVRRIIFRLTEQEFEQLNGRLQQTIYKNISELLRYMVFQRKITVYTRDASMDDFMAEMIWLRNELNAIGNNFNQAVRRLNTFRKVTDLLPWYLENRSQYKQLLDKVGEIKHRINDFADRW